MLSSNRNLTDEQKTESSLFVGKLRLGKVCVHPTDTVPGLTCQPENEDAVRILEQIKKRTQKKPYLGLVPSVERALNFWPDLPDFWREILEKTWPGPLTYIWKARKYLPRTLVSPQGEIALRYPRLDPKMDWFVDAMETMGSPMLSTSINEAGEIPIVRDNEIEVFAKKNKIYLPKIMMSSVGTTASSVIRILDEKNFEFLREGAFSKDDFYKIYSSLQK